MDNEDRNKLDTKYFHYVDKCSDFMNWFAFMGLKVLVFPLFLIGLVVSIFKKDKEA